MLVQLHQEIDARTRSIVHAHGGWPCREGCDSCCRNLAEVPRLSRAEWQLVEEGLTRLSESELLQIQERVQPGSRVCPFLDPDAGRCLIYDHRPVACRTYGFYVERDRGLYCRMIEQQVDAGEMGNVIWGNAESIEAKLAEYGEKIPLPDWFSDWLRASPAPAPIPSSDRPGPCGAPSPAR